MVHCWRVLWFHSLCIFLLYLLLAGLYLFLLADYVNHMFHNIYEYQRVSLAESESATLHFKHHFTRIRPGGSRSTVAGLPKKRSRIVKRA